MAREAGVRVVHVNERHRPSGVDYGIQLEVEPPHCVEGTRGAEIVDELAARDDEPLVVKRRYDGFFDTDLRAILQVWEIENLLFTGVCTELCVASTAYQAKSLDYRNFFIRECLAGATIETHEAGLTVLRAVHRLCDRAGRCQGASRHRGSDSCLRRAR